MLVEFTIVTWYPCKFRPLKGLQGLVCESYDSGKIPGIILGSAHERNKYLSLSHQEKTKGRHQYKLDKSRTSRGKNEKIAKRQKEPWLITTSSCGDQAKAQQIIKLYTSRMQIEEAIRDTKSHRVGFSLSESLTRNRQRLKVLLLIDTLTTLTTWLLEILTGPKQWQYQHQSNTNPTPIQHQSNTNPTPIQHQ